MAASVADARHAPANTAVEVGRARITAQRSAAALSVSAGARRAVAPFAARSSVSRALGGDAHAHARALQRYAIERGRAVALVVSIARIAYFLRFARDSREHAAGGGRQAVARSGRPTTWQTARTALLRWAVVRAGQHDAGPILAAIGVGLAFGAAVAATAASEARVAVQSIDAQLVSTIRCGMTWRKQWPGRCGVFPGLASSWPTVFNQAPTPITRTRAAATTAGPTEVSVLCT